MGAKTNRRGFIRKVGGYGLVAYVAARELAGRAEGAVRGHTFGSNVYTRAGVRPFIMANIPFTFLSATLMWPEVRKAMEEAAHYFVDIVALQKAAGKRLAEISGAESGMITSGAAGAMATATAACIAGADPEKIWRLPDSGGMTNRVLMWGGRSIFDNAIRLAGGRPEVVKTLDELRAAAARPAAMLYTGYPSDPEPENGSGKAPPLRAIVSICKQAGVPVFVDAAGGVPPIENLKRYSRMGVDLYAFSGGKGLMGPQCSGLLLGRRDLIEAALANSSPVEGAVCRPMKVGKEEIIGCLTAVEKWLTVDLKALYREQDKKLSRIAAMAETVAGVETEINTRRGSNSFRQLIVRWDEERFGMTVTECGRRLREGSPPIEVLSNYNPYLIRVSEFHRKPAADEKVADKKVPAGSPLTVFSLGLQKGEELIVGRRLRQVLREARA